MGIGSEEDAPALWAADAYAVATPADIPQMIDFRAFRPEDTLLLVRPTILKVSEYRDLHRVAEGEGLFQVIGHEPMVLSDDGAIADFRDLRAVISRTAPVQEAVGRKSKISYSLDQAEAILRKYYSSASPAEVQEICRKGSRPGGRHLSVLAGQDAGAQVCRQRQTHPTGRVGWHSARCRWKACS